MLAAKIPKQEAEKLRQFLVKNNLLLKNYKPIRARKYVYFPVKQKFEFLGIEFCYKKFQAIKLKRPEDLLKDKLTKEELPLLPKSFDIIGDILIFELDKKLEKKEKIIAEAFLKCYKNIKVVAKKTAAISGRYRTRKLKILAGENRKETVHKENNVLIKLDVEKCYFSPRLANERLRIAKLVKPKEHVLVMFSGVGPYCLVIAKNSKAEKIYGIEINPIAHKYALKNVRINKLNNVFLFKGDVRKVLPKIREMFDRIVMPLPKDSPTFLNLAIKKLRPHGTIHLYLFAKEKDFENIIKKYSKIFKVKLVKCGQYAPEVYRICLDLKKR